MRSAPGDGSTTFRYDPADPTPSFGGALPGHRIRLQVSGGAHPQYLRNYGTGEPPGPATRMVATETTLRHTSTLVLTVV